MAVIDVDVHILSDIINTQKDIKILMIKQDKLMNKLVVAIKEIDTKTDVQQKKGG